MHVTPTDHDTAPADSRRILGDAMAARPGAASRRPARTALLSTVLALWLAVVVAVAAASGFVATGPPLATIVAVALPLTAVVIAHRTVAAIRTWIAGLDLAVVLALQAWRVIGIAFLFGWVAGDLPAAFAIPAALGDAATGVAAVPIALAAARGRLTRRALVGFTALGVGDFLVAVAVGASLQPAALETLPWVLFPTLAVPAFSILHVLAFLVPAARR